MGDVNLERKLKNLDEYVEDNENKVNLELMVLNNKISDIEKLTKGLGSLNIDANTIKATSMVRVTDVSTNLPNTAGGVLLTFNQNLSGNNVLIQLYISNDTNNSMYYRLNWYGTYSKWLKVTSVAVN